MKSEILNGAQKLFQQYGLKKTTMDEIATACGRAKSTLYYYFDSKEDVFDAVLHLEIINLRKLVKSKVDTCKSMAEKVQTYILEFHKEVINKANLYSILKKEDYEVVATRIRFIKVMEFEKSYILRILEDGYDSGEFQQMERNDLPWVSEMFLAGFLGVVQYSLEKDGFFDEAKIQKTINLITGRVLC